MKKKIIIMLVGFLLGGTSYVQAKSTQKIPATIKAYAEALKTKNQGVIAKAWKKLTQTPEELANLKKNFPHYFQLYKLGKLKARLTKLRASYADSGFITRETPDVKHGRQRASINGFTTNQTTTRINSNQTRISNNKTARRYRNQTRTPNNRIALRASNRTRTSNQKIIRSRKRRR